MEKAEDFQIDETTLARYYGSGSAIEIPQGVETIAAGFLLHDYLISVSYTHLDVYKRHALVSNVVLSQFLGICSFVGVSKKVETAAGMGGAVIFVITIASIVASLIYDFVPVSYTHLRKAL